MARIIICLDIEGSPDDAFAVVDALLDEGVPQHYINHHEREECGPLRVRSAVATIADVVPAERHADLFPGDEE